jgi:hypothetical protein
MVMALLYLLLSLLGFVLPYCKFVPWLMEHGPDVPLMVRELFATRIGAFFGIDVLLAAVTSLAFMRRESKRLGLRGVWMPMAAVCLVGVSCGLPLFLFMRERAARVPA